MSHRARTGWRAHRASSTERWPAGVPSDQPFPAGRATSSAPMCARVNTEQSNTTVLVGTDYVVKLFRRWSRHQSGDRDRPVPDRGRAFANTPPLLGTVELVERRRDAARSPWCTLGREPGRRLDGHRRLSRPLRRRAAAAARRCATGESDERGAYLQRMQQVGQPRRRNAAGAGEPRRHAGFRAGADRRG